MKISGFFVSGFIVILLICSCASKPNRGSVKSGPTLEKNNISSDTVRIANEELEYEVIIFEPGFNSWLSTQPPMSNFSQSTLESHNILFVREYNLRVNNSMYYGDLYTFRINYDSTIDYGLEVNYLIYHYFIFFQDRYRQKLR